MIIQEFERLKAGGSDLRKRHDKFTEYINRILQDPKDTDYLKKFA
jgi:hypothetical protein